MTDRASLQDGSKASILQRLHGRLRVTERTASQSAVPIAVQGLSQRLGSQLVLRDVNLAVAPGEFLTLLGASGSGKTTLLMALAGFSLPDSGRILIGGEDVTTMPPHRRDIGIVFQSYALFPHMSVGGNIAYPLRLRGVAPGEIERRVRQALDLVRLSDFQARAIGSLSGGQRQRVALARAIVFRPRILLMDEPLSALDRPLRESMQIELRRLHSELGLTTLYVTHDQREALTLSDRIAVMHAGRIAQIGSPQELYWRPKSAFVARFLGDSTILPVELKQDGAFSHGQRLRLAFTPDPARAYGLLIRPEQLRWRRTPAEEEAGGLVLSGTLQDVIFEGGAYRLQLRLADGSILSMRDPSLDGSTADVPPLGSAVTACVAPRDATLVTMDE